MQEELEKVLKKRCDDVNMANCKGITLINAFTTVFTTQETYKRTGPYSCWYISHIFQHLAQRYCDRQGSCSTGATLAPLLPGFAASTAPAPSPGSGGVFTHHSRVSLCSMFAGCDELGGWTLWFDLTFQIYQIYLPHKLHPTEPAGWLRGF